MKINSRIIINLDLPGVKRELVSAGGKGLLAVIVAITRDAKNDTPWLTGNNSRMIDYKHKGLTGSVYSTSGYGGYLETGYTMRSGKHIKGRPYMRPALDRHIGKLDGLVRKGLKDDFRF